MAAIVKAISSILTQFAKGDPIYTISAPAFIHAPQSGLKSTEEQLFTNGNCLLALERISKSEDALERIGLIILAIINIHGKPATDKPFNPVLGEFIEVTSTVDSLDFRYQVEQISHHPPVASFRLSTPSCTLESLDGIDGADGFTPGFNLVEFRFNKTVLSLSTKEKGIIMTLKQPNIQVSPLFFGKRSVSIVDPSFWILDHISGIKFNAKISKENKISGFFTTESGKVFRSVKGDLRNGVYFRDGEKEMWIKGLDDRPLDIQVSPSVQCDPNYSANVWKKVFEHMIVKNYELADQEKVKVEQKQRKEGKERKERDEGYVSRFGFWCQYMKPIVKKSISGDSGVEFNSGVVVVEEDIKVEDETEYANATASSLSTDTEEDEFLMAMETVGIL